jgi:pectate disaccharide-lyase
MNRVAIALLSIFLSASAVHAETYYISPAGKPTNDGSRGKPWPSLEFALGKAGGGNTFVFLPGVYPGPITVPDAFAGTEKSPTVIKSDEKWKAVIVGSMTKGISVGDHCQWTVVDGFEILGAREEGIKSDADHTIIRNCWIHNNTSMGIGAHHAKDLTIEDNLIEFNGCHIQFDHGIYAGGDGLVIHGNIVRHNAAFGIHLYPAVTNSRIYQNLIYGQEHHAALLVVCPKGDAGTNQIYQNTLVGKSTALELWNANGTLVANNIFTAESGDPVSLLHGTKKINADYNLSWPKSALAETHGLIADPQFLKPSQGIFWLKSTSPAIAKGTADTAAHADFWSHPAPAGTAPDLGAFAYTPWLLDPKSRTSWIHGWPYGYPPDGPEPLPDLWTIPPEPATTQPAQSQPAL